jgi:hypothetical protein
VTLNVASVNDAPVAAGELYNTVEDTVVSIGVVSLLANDSDVDGDTLSVGVLANAVGGSASLAGGTVTFTPTANYNGVASFDYRVDDGYGGSTWATAIVAVQAVQDAPVGGTDSLSGTEDTILSIASATLLANDSDADNDSLSIVGFRNAVGGTVALDGSGNVVFTPTANHNGAASFEYRISDGQGNLVWNSVSVALAAVPDVPVWSNPSFTYTDSGGYPVVYGSLTAVDPDGSGISYAVAVGPSYGSVSIDVNGNVSYSGVSGAQGATETFVLRATDGQGQYTDRVVNFGYSYTPPAPSDGGWYGGDDGDDGSSGDGGGGGGGGSDGGGDPVVLDLDGNGVRLGGAGSGVEFDWDGDGTKEATGWIDPSDAFLVLDDGDNLVVADEIAFIRHHPDATTDMEGLRLAYDSNQDGWLDAQDQRFAEFKLWQDANSNAVVDVGEMRALSEFGIAAISVDGPRLDFSVVGGTIHRLTEFIRDDGTSGVAADVRLDVPSFDAQLAAMISTLALPDSGVAPPPDGAPPNPPWWLQAADDAATQSGIGDD